MKKFISLLFLALILSCTNLSNSGNHKQFSQNEKVYLLLKWTHQYQFAGYYAAIEKGYYSEVGIDVVLIEAVASNDLDLILNHEAYYGIANTGIIMEYMNGKPVTLLVSVFQHSPLAFFTRSDSGVKSPSDFVGATVMMDTNYKGAELLSVLINEGVNIDDLSIIPLRYNYIPEDDDLNVIAGYTTGPMYYYWSMSNNIITIDPRNYGVDFYGDNLYTSYSEYKKHPDRVSKFVSASLKGWDYAMNHPDEMIQLIISNYASNAYPDQLLHEYHTMMELIRPDVVAIGHINRKRWDQIANTYYELGMTESNFQFDRFYMNEPSGTAPTLLKILLIIVSVIIVTTLILIIFNQKLKKAVKKRTEDLWYSEDRYRSLVEAIPDWVWETDTQGNITYSSQRIAELLGYSPSEIIGKSVLIIVVPDTVKEITRKLSAIMNNRESFDSFITQIIHKKGHILFLESSGVPTFNYKGRLTGYRGVSRDVTKRIKIENELKKTNANLHAMIENTDNFIMIADDQGFPVMFNTNYANVIKKFTGVEMKPGLKPHEQSNDIYVKQYWDKIHRRVLNGEQFKIDFHWNPDGNIHYFEFSYYPIYEKDHVIGFCEYARETTQQKNVENELRFFKRTIDEAPVGVFFAVYDDGFISDISYANRGLTEISGFQLEDLNDISEWMNNVFPDTNYKLYIEHTWEHLIKQAYDNQGSTAPRQFRLRHKNGALIETMWLFTAIDNKMIALFIDITEKVEAEREKLEMQEQLKVAQKMEAIGRLTGGIAHDFNNILTPIIAYSDMMLADSIKKGDPNYQPVAEILEAGMRAKALTQQLLAYGRKQMLLVKTVNLNQIILQLYNMLRRTIRENIDLITDLTPQLGFIHADVSQIEQILMNLIINSQDALPKGGQITISTRNVSTDEPIAHQFSDISPGEYVMLSVKDTGIGMIKEVLEKIYEPFFTTKDFGEGTGLGLSTVYGIVKQHNGYIIAESEPNQGTEFRIYFKKTADQINYQKSSPPLSAPADHSKYPGTETILIAEDDFEVGNIAAAILRSLGYEVIMREDTRDILHFAQNADKKIHLLLTDLIMPHLNGKQLADKILKYQPDIKVIFMSGYSSDILKDFDINEPDFHFIQKPFDSGELARMVREVLDG